MIAIVDNKENLNSDNASSNIDIQKTEVTISEENLVKELSEQFKVAKEILDANEAKEIKNVTNPSAIALETPEGSSGEGISCIKKSPRKLFILYLTNPMVARAISITADTLISKGYNISGEDKKGVELCEELIKNSGGINLFWQLCVNTEISGNGFLEKIYSQDKKQILRLKHVHPITMDFKKDLTSGKIIVDSKGEPEGYVQYYANANGTESTKDISKDIIAHLKFNCLGDEFEGLSAIQPGYDTIVRLMNMEYAAAESAIKTANPLIVGKCNTKSPSQIAMWGTILGRINGRDQVFLPQDMDIDFKSPQGQNFSAYADYFINIVVSTFGIPKSVLLGGGDSGSGNRAESIVLSRHFYSVIRRKQQYVSEFIKKIFEEYGELSGFEAPDLIFDDIAEDAVLTTDSAIKLLSSGIISADEAREMIGLEKQTGSKKVEQPVSEEIKKSNMQVAYPEESGSPAGSQKNIKKKAKLEPI